MSAVSENGKPLAFEHKDDRLAIRLEPRGRAGEPRSVVVRYRGVPATGLLIANNKHGERTFFSDNWPIKARQWLPTIDHPYDKAASEMWVTAPSHYQVVSNGVLAEETDQGDGRRVTRWRQAVPIATWLNTLGVARFAVDHRPAWRGLPIETWVYRQDRDNGFALFADPTTAVLEFLSEHVGPYSYERLGNVQANGVRGGMESATSIFYGDDAVNEPRSLRWRNVIIHEISHQWFGNSVTESDWDHVWLSEGFATYFTYLFIEHAYGRDEMIAGLVKDRDEIREFDKKTPSYRIIHDNLSDMSQVLSGTGTYKKGSWTLHMLRGIVGDAAFWTGIRDYYRSYQNKNATTADLRRALEQASGRELAWFFDQWLTRGGFPKLARALDLRRFRQAAPAGRRAAAGGTRVPAAGRARDRDRRRVQAAGRARRHPAGEAGAHGRARQAAEVGDPRPAHLRADGQRGRPRGRCAVTLRGCAPSLVLGGDLRP